MTELRTMEASRGGPCHYCKDEIELGSDIAGHYGILWGHDNCVESALTDGRLILSPNNKAQRPSELEALCDRRWWGNRLIELTDAELEVRGEGILDSLFEEQRLLKEMKKRGVTVDPDVISQHRPEGVRPKKKPARKKKVARKRSPRGLPPEFFKEPEKYLERPESCPHFVPQLIQIVTMPKSMRPADHIIEEFEACPESLQEIVDRQWRDYLKERFAAWKKDQQHLPMCEYHSAVLRGGKHRKPVHHSVIHMDLAADGFKWKRALWWVCPGKDEEDNGTVD